MSYPMNIGEAAQAAGLTAKMIRDYEALGLIPQASRTESGYRQYTKRDVDMLRFIRQARSMSFSIKQVEQLLSLWSDTQRESSHVKALAQAQMAELDRKIERMEDEIDSMSEMGEMESLRLQMAMDRMSKMMSTLSNLLKKISDTQNSIVQNIK